MASSRRRQRTDAEESISGAVNKAIAQRFPDLEEAARDAISSTDLPNALAGLAAARDETVSRRERLAAALEDSPLYEPDVLVTLAAKAGAAQGQAQARTSVLMALSSWSEAVKADRPKHLFERFRNRTARIVVAASEKWPGKVVLGAASAWLATHGFVELGSALIVGGLVGQPAAVAAASKWGSASALSRETATQRQRLARSLDLDIAAGFERTDLISEWNMRGGSDAASETLDRCTFARNSALGDSIDEELVELASLTISQVPTEPKLGDLLTLGVTNKKGKTKVKESELVDVVSAAKFAVSTRFRHDDTNQIKAGPKLEKYEAAIRTATAADRLQSGQEWESVVAFAVAARRTAIHGAVYRSPAWREIEAFVTHYRDPKNGVDVDPDVLAERALDAADVLAGETQFAFGDKPFSDLVAGDASEPMMRQIATGQFAKWREFSVDVAGLA